MNTAGKEKDKEEKFVTYEESLGLLQQKTDLSFGAFNRFLMGNEIRKEDIPRLLTQAFLCGNHFAARLLKQTGQMITENCVEELIEAQCLPGIQELSNPIYGNYNTIRLWGLPLAAINEDEEIAKCLLNDIKPEVFLQTLPWATSWYIELCIKNITDKACLSQLLTVCVERNEGGYVAELLKRKANPVSLMHTVVSKGYDNFIWPLLFNGASLEEKQYHSNYLDPVTPNRLAKILEAGKIVSLIEKFRKVQELIKNANGEKIDKKLIDQTTPIGHVQALMCAYKHLLTGAYQKDYAKKILEDITNGSVTNGNLKEYIKAHKTTFNQKVKKNPTSGYEALLEYILSEHFDAKFPEHFPSQEVQWTKGTIAYQSEKKESLKFRLKLITQLKIEARLLPEGKDYKKLFELLDGVVNLPFASEHLIIKESWQIEALLDDDLTHWPDFNKKDNWGAGPGLYFIWSGDLEKINKYKHLPMESQSTRSDMYNTNSLFYAGCSNNTDVVNWVIDNDPKINETKLLYNSLMGLAYAKRSFVLEKIAAKNPQLKNITYLPKGDYPQSLAYLAALSGCPKTLNIALSMQTNPGGLDIPRNLSWWYVALLTTISTTMDKALDSNTMLIGCIGYEGSLTPSTLEKLQRNRENKVTQAKLLVYKEIERLLPWQKETPGMKSSKDRVVALEKLLPILDFYDTDRPSLNIKFGGWYDESIYALNEELNNVKTAVTPEFFKQFTGTETYTCLKKIVKLLEIDVVLEKVKTTEARSSVTISTTGYS